VCNHYFGITGLAEAVSGLDIFVLKAQCAPPSNKTKVIIHIRGFSIFFELRQKIWKQLDKLTFLQVNPLRQEG
jgi:hypothetical protein